ATVTNSAGGVIHANADAQATDAIAKAHAAGVSQYALDVATANLTTINQGVIAASAYAAAHGDPEAIANAFGVNQIFEEVFNPLATVHNTDLMVAHAQASAPLGDAIAQAGGIRIQDFVSAGGPLTLEVENSGNLLAVAKAQGGEAFAEG